MTRKEHLHRRAEVYFTALKQVLQEIERYGDRPNLIVHANGMPDCLSILDAHATTPVVDAIRAAKKSELATAHAA